MSSLRIHCLAAILTGTLAILALAACEQRAAAPSTPDLRSPERVAAGRLVYDKYCAACHGAQLEGQPNWTSRLPDGRLPAPPHDDSGHTWHHPSEVLFALTKNGLVPPHAPPDYQSNMPAFKGVLSDDEIWNVLAYIRSRWSDPVRARHDALDASYAQQLKQHHK